MEKIDDEVTKEDLVPTPCHYFMRMIYEKQLVHRIFTQNTDDLHITCGLSDETVIHAHGRVGHGACAVCGHPSSTDDMFDGFREGVVRWCKKCANIGQKGPIKPNVVFFNEALPKIFH